MNNARVDAFLRQLAALNAPDLRSVLDAVFGAQSYEGDRTIMYSNQAGHALSMVYLASGKGRNPDGVVRELRREAALTEDDVTRLRELMATVQGPQTDHMASFFHFSSRPVTKSWRYGDKFQILPPPPDAPLPETVIGDWPFLIEARFSSPDQFGFKVRREMQTVNRLRLLLPVLLIGPMYQPHAQRPTKHWVIPPPNLGPSSPEQSRVRRLLSALHLRPQQQSPAFRVGPPIYAQEYYEVEGRVLGGSTFSPIDPAIAASLVADYEAYYRTRGIRAGDVLEFPAVLTQLFDNYYALDEETAARYRRACYWFNLGRFFYGYSGSTSFFALVAAIESLLKSEAPHTCPACDAAHHPSISRAFRNFLEQYVPDRPDRERFYDLRSQIAHGSALLQFDIQEEFGGFYPGDLDQREQMDELYRVCRIALINWLLTRIRR